MASLSPSPKFETDAISSGEVVELLGGWRAQRLMVKTT